MAAFSTNSKTFSAAPFLKKNKEFTVKSNENIPDNFQPENYGPNEKTMV
jgi:hypothetical protein